MRTVVYVDGYNLYYGLKQLCGPTRQWRWLDLERFCEVHVPSRYDIQEIKYFTARVKPLTSSRRKRQELFLRALGTLPRVTPVYGRYERYEAEFAVSRGTHAGQYVWVWKTEEKESDVKLASHMLLDALVSEKPIEAAVLVSNDSDQAYPLKLLKRAGVDVGVINPHPKRPSGHLHSIATFYRQVRPGPVTKCQMPAELHDAGGAFEIPPRWLAAVAQ